MLVRLVADVGGTNVRFGCAAADGRLVYREDYRTGDFASFGKALETYMSGLPTSVSIASASVAAAGPLANGAIVLTNGSWSICADEIGRQLNGVEVVLMNDLQAAALSIPYLTAEHYVVLSDGNRAGDPTTARVAVNVGTGFGASTLVHSSGGWISLPSESGHMSLPVLPDGPLDTCALRAGSFRSIEDILSGPGLLRLYAYLRGSEPDELSAVSSPQEVLARKKTDAAARQTVDGFARLLACVCGDLVLTHCAWDGVFLFGSVAREWIGQADKEIFIDQFSAKGKMAEAMNGVPVCVVMNTDAPMLGLAQS